MGQRKLSQRTSLETPGKVSNRCLLVLKRRSVLVVEPTKLLKNFGVIWIIGHNPFVRHLGAYKLQKGGWGGIGRG